MEKTLKVVLEEKTPETLSVHCGEHEYQADLIQSEDMLSSSVKEKYWPNGGARQVWG